MLAVSITVGGLIEIRGRGPLDAAAFANFRTTFTDALVTVKGRLRFIADLRGLEVTQPEIYASLLRMMKMDSPLLERGAYLLEPGTLLERNIRQVVSDAKHGGRQIFFDAGQAERWLSPQLTGDEPARLRAFLAQP